MQKAGVTSFELEIPIRALKTASVYLLDTGDKRILVDSGMTGHSSIRLRDSGVSLKDIDMLAITHLHVDHIGGALEIQEESQCDVAMGSDDFTLLEGILSDPDAFKKRYLMRAVENGASRNLAEEISRYLPFDSSSRRFSALEVTKKLKGDGILFPGIENVAVPGHSPGSQLYIFDKKRSAFTGDHLLQRITPNISDYGNGMDMLSLYLESLERTRKLALSMCYPGHGMPFGEVTNRIDEIISHHSSRLDEIHSALKDWKTAFQAASEIRWNRGRSISDMNAMEKNFAIGEALSHIIHLETLGKVRRRERSGITEFRSNS